MSENNTVIEQVIEKGRIALKPGVTIDEVRKAMAAPYVPDTARTEMVPFPEPPKPVVIDDKVIKALRNLQSVFAVVQPTERRALEQDEMEEVFDEYETINAIADLLATRKEGIKTLVRTHMDVRAEETGKAHPVADLDDEGNLIEEATDRTKDGHYILASKGNPEREPIPGTNQEWSREYRAGSTTLNTSLLETLLEEGKISRPAYLAMTREQRVFDEHKTLGNAINDKELRDEILLAIKEMTTSGTPVVSLYVRKA